MQEKIIEIIVYILSEIKGSKQISEINVDNLSNAGYSEAEINTAFAWILSKIENNEMIYNDANKESKSFRFFHQKEKDILTPEAIGYLIQLRELSLISQLEEEVILEKLLYTEFNKIGVEELKNIIAPLIFGFTGKTESRSKIIFQNNDTIH
jgi:uncharacterized protein Smg (DUF494 family)